MVSLFEGVVFPARSKRKYYPCVLKEKQGMKLQPPRVLSEELLLLVQSAHVLLLIKAAESNDAAVTVSAARQICSWCASEWQHKLPPFSSFCSILP